MKNKIRNNRIFSQREIQYLVLSPFMVAKNDRTRIIKDVCLLIEEIKKQGLYDDSKMYFPLVLAINQYVSDENEREKLIEVLTMDEPVDEIYEKVISSGIFEKGLDQGLEEGKFEFALKYKRLHGIDEAVKFSGFSREELENEELGV